MTERTRVQMDESEIEAFLGTGGTGVLALAKDGDPYAIPISYGFDAETHRFVVRLGLTSESEKRAFLEPTARARLVVYDAVDAGWQSVIATGRLERITEADVDDSVVGVLRDAALPIQGMFDVRPEAVEFDLYQLVADELTGRKTVESG